MYTQFYPLDHPTTYYHELKVKNTKWKTYNNKMIMQIGTCYIILTHKKEKVCKSFVVPGSDPALLSMQDIDILGVLTINFETIGRQLTSDDNADNRKGSCHYERAVKTGGWMPESYAYNRQDVDAQKVQAEGRMPESYAYNE